MNKKNAFTLIELLVVIAIIGILAGILLPALAKAKQKVKCMQGASHKGQLQLAWQSYADDHDGEFAKNNPSPALWLNPNKRPMTYENGIDSWCPHGTVYEWDTVTRQSINGRQKMMAVVDRHPSEIDSPLPNSHILLRSQQLSPTMLERYPIYSDGITFRGKLFMHGQLGEYVDNAKMFTSPGENVTVGGKAINRSVAMNCSVGMDKKTADWYLRSKTDIIFDIRGGGNLSQAHYDRAAQRGIGNGNRNAKQASDWFGQNTSEAMVQNPSDLFVFIDQNMAFNPSPVFIPPIDMGAMGLRRMTWRNGITQWKSACYDLPSSYNGGRYTLGFADGHAEQKRHSGLNVASDGPRMRNSPRIFSDEDDWVDVQTWDYLTTVSQAASSAGGGNMISTEF